MRASMTLPSPLVESPRLERTLSEAENLDPRSPVPKPAQDRSFLVSPTRPPQLRSVAKMSGYDGGLSLTEAAHQANAVGSLVTILLSFPSWLSIWCEN